MSYILIEPVKFMFVLVCLLSCDIKYQIVCKIFTISTLFKHLLVVLYVMMIVFLSVSDQYVHSLV